MDSKTIKNNGTFTFDFKFSGIYLYRVKTEEAPKKPGLYTYSFEGKRWREITSLPEKTTIDCDGTWWEVLPAGENKWVEVYRGHGGKNVVQGLYMKI